MNAVILTGAERARLLADWLRLSDAHADTPRRDDRPWRHLGRHRRSDDPDDAASPGRALCGVPGVSGLLRGALRPCCTSAAQCGCVRDAAALAARSDRRGHLRHPRGRGSVRCHLDAASGLCGSQADARRWRHLVPRRRWQALVSHGRAPARCAAHRDSRSTCVMPLSRWRTTASTRIPASIPSRSAAPSSGTSRSPGTVEGGSTLTQQLARTLFLSNKKTYGRKAREAVLALMIDGQLTKDQVLELYLNRIYLSAGVYGVETMSRHLFGRPAKQLNLAECALIAGLARAPSSLSPWSNLDGAIARSHVVLARMRQEEFITESQEREARKTSIRIRPYPGSADPRGGYAKEFLRQALSRALRRRSSARLGGTHDDRASACRTWRSRRYAAGWGDSTSPSCRRRSWPSTRAQATCWRSSAAATSRSHSSTARAAAGASPVRRSSRFSTPLLSNMATRRCR